MRSIWKGSIAFGLVNVPIRLYSATSDHDIDLHQVHDADQGRIRYQRVCEVCGENIAFEHMDRAYEEGNRTVIVSRNDLATLPASRSHEIEVVEFVPSQAVDPIRMDRSYFLEPDSRSVKAYVLLRQALADTERTAIAHFSLRQKTRLAALRVHGNVLVLQTLLWDDEVREVDFPALENTPAITTEERELAARLVESLSEDFTPTKFADLYQEQLRRLIDAKLASGDDVDTAATFGTDAGSSGGEILDLMEALRRSLEQRHGAEPKRATRKRQSVAPAKRKARPQAG